MRYNVPTLRFFDYNGDWEVFQIGALCEIKTGGRDTQDSVDDGCYPFFVRSNEIRKINSWSFNGPSILTSGDGAGVGKIYHYVDCKYDYHQRVYALRKFIKTADIKFVYFFFSDRFGKRVFRLSAKNSVDSVRMDMISEMKIHLPSLPEQQKIASFLTSVDKRISQLKRKKQLLAQYKKGVMQQIFSQQIRFKPDDGSDYPEWEQKKFGEFLSIPKKKSPSEIDIKKILTVKLHLKGVHINERTESLKIGATKYLIRKKGQFIFGKQNIFNGAIGLVPAAFDGHYSSGDVPTLDIDSHKILPEYFIQFFGRKEFYKRLESISNGSGSKRLHESDLLEISAKSPCLEEQTKIAYFLSAIDVKISHTQKQIELTQQFKKGLLQQMFV